MCKNPADIRDDDYCLPSVSNQIKPKLPYGKTWETITCAELNSTAGFAALQHLQAYPDCCGGNAKVRCLDESGGCCNETGTSITNGRDSTSGSGGLSAGSQCFWAGMAASADTFVYNGCCYSCPYPYDTWSGVFEASGQVKCRSESRPTAGTTGNNGSSTCIGSTSIPDGTTPGAAPAIGTLCKDDQSFNGNSECVARNAAMLSRLTQAGTHAHWSAVYSHECATIGRNKDSLYEYTYFGTMCCGERDKVRCLT